MEEEAVSLVSEIHDLIASGDTGAAAAVGQIVAPACLVSSGRSTPSELLRQTQQDHPKP